ncbi:HD-GYP domain-containing protein [Actinocorallia longicatena]|uniref:HD-GYP domain-containing protein n=1 Tax=Actinocorallia longicatena TaxID=111803 RepID=A0ABP6PW50_9ACTN
MRELPVVARAYVVAVIAAAAVVLAGIVRGPLPGSSTVLILAALFLICDGIPAQLAVTGARVTMSYAAILATIVLLGPTGAAVVGACAVATPQDINPIVKRLFNGAQFSLCGFTAGHVFTRIAPAGKPPLEEILLPFAVTLVVYVVMNIGLTCGILLLARKSTPRQMIRDYVPLAVGCLGFGSFGLLIAGSWPAIGPAAAVLVLAPLAAASWAFSQVAAQKAAHEAVLATMCQAVETKDFYTRGHSERVSRGSVMIAEELKFSAARLEAIRFAGMLHDVGKLGVPTKVLQKDGGLTDEEFAAIQLHPRHGLAIVQDIEFLDEALGGIMHHHEKLNGRGYPLGLAGDEIPEFARIIGVADTFDAMTSTRSYRKARPVEVAVAELRRCSGTEFDPAMVEAFLRALDRRGWEIPPEPGEPPAGAETAKHDHDDPTAPIPIINPAG